MVPPGHDAWCAGKEAAVFVEFSRGSEGIGGVRWICWERKGLVCLLASEGWSCSSSTRQLILRFVRLRMDFNPQTASPESA